MEEPLKNPDILKEYEKQIGEFLDFAARIMKTMQYLRDTTAIDYLMDMEKLPYATADHIMAWLVQGGMLEYDQFGAFPGSNITPKGLELLNQIRIKRQCELAPNTEICESPTTKTIVEPIQVKDVFSTTCPEKNCKTFISRAEHQQVLTEFHEQIVKFLDFANRINIAMQYLRDTTAIDYLTDSLRMQYEQADQLLHVLVEEGFLEYDQFGAFPGTTIGEKGKHFLKDHKKE